MTQQQFDNYNFSSKTEVFLKKEWHKIDGVYFDNRGIYLDKFGKWFKYTLIKDIRN